MLEKTNKILIVGLGLIGGSYAEGFTKKGYTVGAIARRQETIDYALNKGIIASGMIEANPEYLKEFDIIVMGLYPHMVISWIKENQKYFKKNAIITDVTGVKTAIVYTIQDDLRSDLEFVGAHPMAGKEVYGVENADCNIFKGANYIITPTNKNTGLGLQRAKEIGEVLEFKNISVLTPEIHDEMIGFLSQLTHCIAVSLMTCKENRHLVDYTGDSFRDLTRIAKINENMWSELFMCNKQELLKQMDLFMMQFQELKYALASDDVEKMKEIMKLSTERRSYFDKK